MRAWNGMRQKEAESEFGQEHDFVCGEGRGAPTVKVETKCEIIECVILFKYNCC